MKLSLPIDTVLSALCDAVRAAPCVVLSAAPGAGKTTRVPLALLDAGTVAGRILMLEPRRLAAIRAAQYMAQQLAENVGETVGYRIRGESKVSARTKIEVVTEGVLARQIQNDPELSGVGLIIFDEFHERSLHADLGLALARDVQKSWRDDLKIVVMSATLDGVAVSVLLDNAPVIHSEGRSYPVEIIYLGGDLLLQQVDSFAQSVLHAVQRACREQQGDVLVFLPGKREILRVKKVLEQSDVVPADQIHILHGEVSTAMQQSALQKMAGGARKIILSTSIAETSLTIDGVSVVVDAGLVRTAQFDPRRGMSRLLTTRVSQATATQRAGRAGRQQAGACYRLWSAEQHKMLAQFPTPEIAHSDLMPLTLELAQWGVDEKQLAFLSAPPAAHLQQAREKLQILGALDTEQKITAHGRAMVALPVHPRYAHMLLRANEHGMGALACDVAALLDERDVLRGEKDADFYLRWTALQHGGAVDRGARERVKLQVKRLRQMLAISNDSVQHEDKVGLMLALCYPERVARRRDERGERWQLASGAGAVLTGHSILMRELWIAVADLDGDGRDARIYLAAAVQEEDLATFLSELFFSGEEVVWSTQEEAVLAREVQRFGAIIVKEKKLPARGDAVARVLCGGLRQAGWNNLPISDPAQQWLQRVRWLSDNNLADNFPSFDEAHLLATLEDWALPFLKGITRRNQLSQVDWLAALQSRLDYAQQQMLDRLAPAHLVVPTGSRIALDYSGAQPVLPVRLQEMFGAKDTPRIADGKVPVLIHLLSPRQMPLAVTQDLASFWQNAYKEVRKDMRGQYPKHYWPENPLEAEPTRRTKAADDRARKKLS